MGAVEQDVSSCFRGCLAEVTGCIRGGSKVSVFISCI